MLSNISWASYFQIVIFVLFAYYVFVLYKYYRYDLLQFLKRKKNHPTNELAFTFNNQQPEGYKSISDHSEYMPKDDPDSACFLHVQALKDEVQSFIVEAGNNSFDKDQILPSLQLMLSKYPTIELTSYKESIQSLIAQECETNCSVHLSDTELDGLWVQ